MWQVHVCLQLDRWPAIILCLLIDDLSVRSLFFLLPSIRTRCLWEITVLFSLISPELYSTNTCSYSWYLLYRLIRPKWILNFCSSYYPLGLIQTTDKIMSICITYRWTSLAVIRSPFIFHTMWSVYDLADVIVIQLRHCGKQRCPNSLYQTLDWDLEV